MATPLPFVVDLFGALLVESFDVRGKNIGCDFVRFLSTSTYR